MGGIEISEVVGCWDQQVAAEGVRIVESLDTERQSHHLHVRLYIVTVTFQGCDNSRIQNETCLITRRVVCDDDTENNVSSSSPRGSQLSLGGSHLSFVTECLP